jgi:hypothetical protein
MHNISNLFYFQTTLYMFRTVFPSIIRSLRLYIQHQVCVIQILWLLASRNGMELHLVPAGKQSAKSVWHIPGAVCTVLDSWWWTERQCETCTALFQNKINLRYCASCWFYYRNILWCTVLTNVKRDLFISLSEYQRTCRSSVKGLYYPVAVHICTRIWRQQWWAEA